MSENNSNNNVQEIDFGPYLLENFMRYADSVVTDRALPDIRDGLKPVQRRILYDMYLLGLHPNSQYKKSARTVGDVLGKFHPHGDQSVYDALVNMAQDFNKKYPLINGHGNMGSIDGDTSAAMRYTEAKLSTIGELMLQDINMDTVEMISNYDETELEPKILPTLFPQLLANGTSGIAVSVSTSFAPHKVSDIYKALDVILENLINGEETSIEDLIEIVKAPDFPTGGVIVNAKELSDIYKTGKGRVLIRSKYEIEENNGRYSIVITEIPYKVNKAKMVTQIDDLRKTSLSEIKEVRDESDKNGIRVVIELKKNVNYEYVVKVLLKKTLMQSSYPIEHNCLYNGKPYQNVDLKFLLEGFLLHVAEVIRRKTNYQAKVASDRLEIVNAILVVLDNLDTTINIIRSSKTDSVAVNSLINVLKLNDRQAKAIVNMRFSSLTQSSADKYKDEQAKLQNKLNEYCSILKEQRALLKQTRLCLSEVASLFNKEQRLTQIEEDTTSSNSINKRDLVKDEPIIVTFTTNGIVKSVREKEYKLQGRGGTGSQAVKLQENDTIRNILKLNTTDDLLFFTNTGFCYTLPAYIIPISNKNNAGRYIKNFISFTNDESIVNVLPLTKEDKDKQIFIVTKLGTIKQMTAETARSKRGNRSRVAVLKENDAIASVLFINTNDEVMMFSKKGLATRIKTDKVRAMGKIAAGVKGMKLSDNDIITSAIIVNNDKKILLLSANGYAKQCEFANFTTVNRGAKGVKACKLNNDDYIAAVASVQNNDDIFIMTKNNKMVRIASETISCIGRAGRGVRAIKLNNDVVIGIAVTQRLEDDIKNDE